MDRRSAYIRRQKASFRKQKRLAIVAASGIAACALAAFMLAGEPAAEQRTGLGETALAAAAPATGAVLVSDSGKTRRIYRYSIVPGGVADRGELVHAVKTDKVVAAHYASFDVSKASAHTVDKPRAVYVSYRKGDKVYWTASKTMLAQGETVLSDGKNEIRGRCGNRISELPQLPVEAKGPAVAELDAVEAAQEDGQVLETAFAGDEGNNPVNWSHPVGSFPNGAGLLAVTGGQADGAGGAGGNTSMFASQQPGARSTSGGISSRMTLGSSSASSGSTDNTGSTDTGSTNTGSTNTGQEGSGSGGAGGTGTGSGGTAGAPGNSASSPAQPSPGGSDTTPATGPANGGQTPSGTQTPGADPLPTVIGTPTPPKSSMDQEKPSEIPRDPPPLPSTPPVTTEPVKQEPKPSGTVPEPDSLWLNGIAFAAMLALRRKQKRAKD